MLSLRTPIGLGAALSASLAASLLSAAPAQAVVNAPSGGYEGGIQGSPNPAVADCGTAAILGATIFSENFACLAGDKIYGNFALFADVDSRLEDAFFRISVVGTNHTIAASNSFIPGVYGYSYTMTILDALATGQRLASVSTTASSSSQDPPFNLNQVPQWTKTLATTTDFEVIELEASQVAAVIETDPPKPFNPLNRPLVADFISILDVTNVPNNAVDSFSDTVIQLRGEEGDTVPGPLPILGAAAAFGFSRKLRSRIKQRV